MNEPDQSFEQDTEDTLVRDACSVGYYGPKSVYRRRLRAYTNRQIVVALEGLKAKLKYVDFKNDQDFGAGHNVAIGICKETIDAAIAQLKEAK